MKFFRVVVFSFAFDGCSRCRVHEAGSTFKVKNGTCSLLFTLLVPEQKLCIYYYVRMQSLFLSNFSLFKSWPLSIVFQGDFPFNPISHFSSSFQLANSNQEKPSCILKYNMCFGENIQCPECGSITPRICDPCLQQEVLSICHNLSIQGVKSTGELCKACSRDLVQGMIHSPNTKPV